MLSARFLKASCRGRQRYDQQDRASHRNIRVRMSASFSAALRLLAVGSSWCSVQLPRVLANFAVQTSRGELRFAAVMAKLNMKPMP